MARRVVSKRCACACSFITGLPCQNTVTESRERFCVFHRDRFERRRWRNWWAKRRADEAERKAMSRIPVLRWRHWRPMACEEAWSQPATPLGATTCSGGVDRWYENETALYRVPAALNWPSGRTHPTVKRYREGIPRAGRWRNFKRELR